MLPPAPPAPPGPVSGSAERPASSNAAASAERPAPQLAAGSADPPAGQRVWCKRGRKDDEGKKDLETAKAKPRAEDWLPTYTAKAKPRPEDLEDWQTAKAKPRPEDLEVLPACKAKPERKDKRPATQVVPGARPKMATTSSLASQPRSTHSYTDAFMLEVKSFGIWQKYQPPLRGAEDYGRVVGDDNAIIVDCTDFPRYKHNNK
jgi:hypothetical protein